MGILDFASRMMDVKMKCPNCKKSAKFVPADPPENWGRQFICQKCGHRCEKR